MRRRRLLATCLTTVACLCFSAGMVLPMFKMQAAAGHWTPLVKLFAPGEFDERTFTLPGGILTLWSGGEVILACILGTISLILPVAKFTVLWWECLAPEHPPTRVVVFFRIVSRYSMVEVLLIALTVLLVKGMPGGSHISVGAGTYAFTASVILGLAAGEVTRRAL